MSRFSAEQKRSLASCRLSRKHILDIVPHHKRLLEVDVKVLRRLQNHAGFWLSAVAVDFIFNSLAIESLVGVMRAKINRVQIRALFAKQIFEPIMNLPKLCKSAVAARDDGLIGD